MAYTDEILTEARNIVAGSAGVVDLGILSRAFLAKRLSNSATMEGAKGKAMELLMKKLEDDTDDWTAGKLLSVVEMISEHTGRDLKALLDAQAAMSKASPGANVGTSLFGEPTGAEAPAGPVPVRREAFKMLDGLVQVAEAVAHVKRTEQPPE
jgi:hypothetical protein